MQTVTDIILRDRVFQIQILILLTITIVIMSFNFFWGGFYFIDDAYITFRYAKNFADGHGIVWNIADAPTQGSTTFGFVILLGFGLKLGLSAEMIAFFLNTIGMIFIVFTLHLTYRWMFKDDSLLAFIPALCLIFYYGTLMLTTSGMESVFWTGILYATVLAIMVYSDKQHSLALGTVFLLSYFSCLTRPESAIIVGLWFIYLLWISSGKKRLQVVAGIAVFGMAGLIYVLFLQSYFGYILPNSFYVKVGNSLEYSGIEYILLFLITLLLKWITIISIVGIILLILHRKPFPVPHLAFLILLPIYLFTNPLMGFAFRFVHPTAILFVFVLAISALYHFRFIGQAINHSKNQFVTKFRYVWLALLGIIAAVLFWLAFFAYGTTQLVSQFKAEPTEVYLENPEFPIWQTARALASVPDIENVSIIYGDAGIIAYETMAYYIDPVGLNNSLIAREAKEKGALWVVDYLMEQNADLIAFYTNYDGQIFNAGHGVVGTAYSDLYRHVIFQENYTEIAAIDNDLFIARWFIHNDSMYKDAIDRALAPIRMDNPPPIKP